FVGVPLDLRPEIHEPVIETEEVLKSVRMPVIEMHFADEAGVIAASGEMMSDSGRLPAQKVGVVDDAGRMGVQPGQQRSARRGADRIWTNRVRETDAARGDAIDIRRRHD